MKVLAIVVIFASLAFLATAQDNKSECPEELRTAFHSVKDVCRPVLKKYMKGPKGPAESRKKRQSDDSADIESCLEKIKAETAFAEIVATCSTDGEEALECFAKEFKKACPPPPHFRHHSSEKDQE